MNKLRKEACSGSIHDLAHIPTQNCLSDCLTKASGFWQRKQMDTEFCSAH